MAEVVRQQRVAVNVVVQRGSKVLLGFHHKTGTWNMPGGKVESGEHPSVAAARELKEETGIALPKPYMVRKPWNVVVAQCGHRCEPGCSGALWTVIFYRVVCGYELASDPDVETLEPEAISDWQWVPFHRDSMPRPLCAGVAGLFAPGMVQFGHLFEESDGSELTVPRSTSTVS